MIVTRDLSPEARLKPGTEVLAIDGVRSSDILARLMTIARADGSNDAKRVAYLEVLGTGKYEAFDIFLPLFFPAIGERMELLVREPASARPGHDRGRRPGHGPAQRPREAEQGAAAGRVRAALAIRDCSTSGRPTCACRAGRSTTASGIGGRSSNAASTTWSRGASPA